MNIKKEKKEFCGLGLLLPSYRWHLILIWFSTKPTKRKKHSKFKESPAICFWLHGRLHDKLWAEENRVKWSWVFQWIKIPYSQSRNTIIRSKITKREIRSRKTIVRKGKREGYSSSFFSCLFPLKNAEFTLTGEKNRNQVLSSPSPFPDNLLYTPSKSSIQPSVSGYQSGLWPAYR